MKLHGNHRTCPSSRLLICRRVLEEGWTLQRAAAAAGCSTRTAAKCGAFAKATMSCSTAPRAPAAVQAAFRSDGLRQLSACAACA